MLELFQFFLELSPDRGALMLELFQFFLELSPDRGALFFSRRLFIWDITAFSPTTTVGICDKIGGTMLGPQKYFKVTWGEENFFGKFWLKTKMPYSHDHKEHAYEILSNYDGWKLR